MTNKILCASLVGTQTKIIEIESAFTRGLPSFSITGLATSSTQESKQRVQSALATTDFTLPPLKITINLSPSDIAKSGSYFDLPIALVLCSSGLQLKEPWFAFGELGLDGSIKYTQSMYPLLFDLALLCPNAHIIVPSCAQEILGVIPNLKLHFAHNLTQALEILNLPQGEEGTQEPNDLSRGSGIIIRRILGLILRRCRGRSEPSAPHSSPQWGCTILSLREVRAAARV